MHLGLQCRDKPLEPVDVVQALVRPHGRQLLLRLDRIQLRVRQPHLLPYLAHIPLAEQLAQLALLELRAREHLEDVPVPLTVLGADGSREGLEVVERVEGRLRGGGGVEGAEDGFGGDGGRGVGEVGGEGGGGIGEDEGDVEFDVGLGRNEGGGRGVEERDAGLVEGSGDDDGLGRRASVGIW